MFRSIILLLMLLLVACQDRATPDGHIAAIKDLERWSSNATAVFEPAYGDSLISIVGKVFNNQDNINEELNFSKIPPRVGIYKVSIGGAPHNYMGIGISYAKLEAGGHIISEFYKIDTFYQNTFSVDYYDESSRTLKATFECRLKYDNGLGDTTYTLFKDGSIEVSIEDY